MTQAQLGPFLLRDLTPFDAPALFVMTGDPVTTRYMGFRTHETVTEAAALIERYASGPSKWQAVCPSNDVADVLGAIGFEARGHQAAVTIIFRRDWKARGAGREVSVPFVLWLFAHERVKRVSAYCHVDNVPVQRVLERMGALREGRLRSFDVFPNLSDEPQDVYVYSIVKG